MRPKDANAISEFLSPALAFIAPVEHPDTRCYRAIACRRDDCPQRKVTLNWMVPVATVQRT